MSLHMDVCKLRFRILKKGCDGERLCPPPNKGGSDVHKGWLLLKEWC